jgi:Uncharacterized conserved protein (DUF2075)
VHRASYSRSIGEFLTHDSDAILGLLVEGSSFPVELTQRNAWTRQIGLLKNVLASYRDCGSVYLEFAVPRLGKRVDAIVVIHSVIFVVEFKIGESKFTSQAMDQVCDYALDLKNFHEPSHTCVIAPILVATEAKHTEVGPIEMGEDKLIQPIAVNAEMFGNVFATILAATDMPPINVQLWERGRYCPTPTIIEAATALYCGHRVEDISRNGAEENLSLTSNTIAKIIEESRASSRKSICFVTGVPGAGKTLVGLDIANRHRESESDLYSVFLSGNGPLVKILCEALARDKVRIEAEKGVKIKKGDARRSAESFIQNIHHFRDECLIDQNRPPIEHVAIFDEAQRAWNLEKTSSFMRQKKGHPGFDVSEPEFLISCMNRHQDWAVIVCLVGGGQEINIGEAGISEWIDSLLRSFPSWHLYISSRLMDSEYGTGEVLKQIQSLPNVETRDELHLSVSMRSFRAENVSLLVKQLLDLDQQGAAATLRGVANRYPIVLTRSLARAKNWLRTQARGTERFGIVVSSKAQRLKPYAIDVRPHVNPVNWFLDGKDDVRSSYYLEDVATEFDVQGLELDWACVTWDADFRLKGDAWAHWNFVGNRWQQIRVPERQRYLKNAYRVLLTRARQGMVIVVPEGETNDPTRNPKYYDPTFEYLCQIGFDRI